MGRQLGDNGAIEGNGFKVEIEDCKKTPNGKVIHIGKVTLGVIEVSDEIKSIVNINRRKDIERNHTATHLLQSALRKVLGNHVQQSGSLVAPDRLRFDFTHFEGISSEDLRRVEIIVNDMIMEAVDLVTVETSIDEARKMGAFISTIFDSSIILFSNC